MGRVGTRTRISRLTCDKANKIANKIANEFGGVERNVFTSMTSDNVNRTVCMLCMSSHEDSLFSKHFYEAHPTEDSDTEKVIIRMGQVRLSRFCQSHIVSRKFLRLNFGPHAEEIETYLQDIGFVVKKSERSSVGDVKQCESKIVEQNIEGVNLQLAKDICSILCKDNIALPEVEFEKSVILENGVFHAARQHRVFCHLCERVISKGRIGKHVMVKHNKWTDSFGVAHDAVDVAEVLKRIWEMRLARYHQANPIPAQRIQQVCAKDVDSATKLETFLIQCGFVINRGETVLQCESDACPSIPLQDNSSDNTVFYMDSPASSERDSDTMSERSDTSNSLESSASFNVPYCVLNAIPSNIKVLQALYELVDTMDSDVSFVPDAQQYNFLLGYATFGLAISNGCKLNVISKLTMRDMREAVFDERTGLRVMSFCSNQQCTKAARREFVVADDVVWRAIDIFAVARHRLVSQKGAALEYLSDNATFFLTFSLIRQCKDINYPMRQFLRMISFDWPCRARDFSTAAAQLLVRENSKIDDMNYALGYFLRLRKLEENQLKLIGKIESNDLINRISVSISIKKRIRKGSTPILKLTEVEETDSVRPEMECAEQE